MDDTACPVCQTSVDVPYVHKIDNRESLDRLLAGALNTASCLTCGTTVIAEYPVYIDFPEPGVPFLSYAPLSLLEDDSVCEMLNENECYRHLCYSLDELAR